MDFQSAFRRCGLLAGLVCGLGSVSQAAVIFDTTTSLSASDSTELGRIGRTGVPSDWSAAKAFPGVINTTVSYSYRTFDIDTLGFNFIQINIFDFANGANLFLAAYSPSYTAPATATNYLGDAGSSPDYFGADAVTFQVIVPTGQHLILVLNETAGGANSATAFGHLTDIQVEGFTDTDFNDTLAPEPSAIILTGSGLALSGLIAFLRRRKTAA